MNRPRTKGTTMVKEKMFKVGHNERRWWHAWNLSDILCPVFSICTLNIFLLFSSLIIKIIYPVIINLVDVMCHIIILKIAFVVVTPFRDGWKANYTIFYFDATNCVMLLSYLFSFWKRLKFLVLNSTIKIDEITPKI